MSDQTPKKFTTKKPTITNDNTNNNDDGEEDDGLYFVCGTPERNSKGIFTGRMVAAIGKLNPGRINSLFCLILYTVFFVAVVFIVLGSVFFLRFTI